MFIRTVQAKGGKFVIRKHIKALQGRKAGILGEDEFIRSAVMLPLIEDKGEIKLLFEKRSAELDYQPGEICFPGGKVEPSDGVPQNTAIRETCEELGVLPEQLEMVAPLDVFVSPFNIVVTPFVAYLKDYQQIRFNPAEVEKIFSVPLNHFLQNEPQLQTLKLNLTLPEDYPYHLIPHGRNYPWRQGIYQQYFYLWQDEVIWGMTANILHNFISLL
jgi:coenzyme A diphosphatase NUDT7